MGDVATADDARARPERDPSGRMSQTANEGARHFYSIVVIDFIMSDIEARSRIQARRESLREIMRP